MRRNEPGPALPAWLQDGPDPGPEPARRGVRRGARETGNPANSLPPEDDAASLVVSVPLTMAFPPRTAAGEEPDASSAPEPEPESSPEPEPVQPDPVLEPGDRDPGSVPEDALHDGIPHVLQRLDQGPSSVDLESGTLVRRSRRSAGRWRESVHRLTGGRFDAGGSERHEDLIARIRQPVPGDYRIAVLSLKGGVGKTTTTIGLGSTFASLRGDCVIAVDANPDFGTLAQRVPRQTDSTVRDLLADIPRIQRYSDVRIHTSQAPSRLEVLASERDPAASEAFSEDDYLRIVDVLQVFYNIILTDCGTGIMHSVMSGVLASANTLVLVASPAVDAARSAAATLDWLQAHGYGDLVERTVVVISSPRPGSANVDMDALIGHFLARCRAVKVVPFDEHLAEGAEIDLERLRPATRAAFVDLAAMVADDFPALSGRHAVY
ncbi:MinD/ParA family ATP-binding protein [Rhodococcus sp. CH91]|uniref:MinD/ParA family ATP-binding protein n=1 Tax=Rhodococcus sp. CH91 TaxID=2910256 RepID=UPI001F4A8B86|nr:MinD/ParA family protein [Rhodococcus sp. CH91]